MKKIGWVVLTGIVMIAGAGLGVSQMHASENKAYAKQENNILSEQEVIDIAQRESGGKVNEVELKYKGEDSVYEVEVIKSGLETEIMVDGKTGEILVKETEAIETDTEESDKKELAKPGISMKQAEEKAVHAIKAKGKVTEVKLKNDDGKLIYEVEMESGNQETEVKLDAHSGKILEINMEQED
ncbi:hypothetical protein GXN76_02555 [Kroppenstedtia pulmonis]|uniref:PepSY domain-containing protein n=1 Tax=Kroppenstedtia pulmonis TaxID=1380685 RepID=A0A7D3XPH6_9BACL|nr:PepSY domain-containing protein [Kroppenstedtia pulmonis]QKG83462.1 hypothetical protein GXN76_02555 [Kroppenstedtia pulmonis]